MKEEGSMLSRRRAIQVAAGTCSALFSGCLGGCRGVAMAIELAPPAASDVEDVLNFDAQDLSQEERDILTRATKERVVGCTPEPELQSLVEMVAAHAGVSEHDFYYSDGEAATPALFEQERYQAVIIYDTAESAGGPL